jgi:CO/xanthine dehydrogenase FAD-binding subunit
MPDLMSVVVPRSLPEVYAALAEEPDALLLMGGTDLMVEVNFGHRRPTSVVALQRVEELRGWRREGDQLVLGAGLTYTEMETGELAALLPALAQAARTVGSPQIRNAGTLGGNLGTASPAGDTLPVLAALDAVVVLGSAAGVRELPWDEFCVGPKRTARRDGEVILAVRVAVPSGPQEFLKVGTRNAMVIAVASVALVADVPGRSVRVGLGSVGPTPLRAPDAEAWVAGRIDWDARRLRGDGAGDAAAVAAEFGVRVAAAARPIDDHRSTADYRRHAVGVCARRALARVFP